MGKRYVQHSDLCGCERCAREAERENPQPVYDAVDDPDILDCGCSAISGCNCDLYDDYDDFDEYDPADECMLEMKTQNPCRCPVTRRRAR